MTGDHIILKGSTMMAITECPIESVVLETPPAVPAYKDECELLVVTGDGCGYIQPATDSDNA